jgi:CHAT domain-containing protein
MVVGEGRGRCQQPLTGDGSDDTSSALPSNTLEMASRLRLSADILQGLRNFTCLIIIPSQNLGSIHAQCSRPERAKKLIDLVSLVVMPSFSTLFEPRERSIDFKRSFVVGDPILIKEDKLARRGKFKPLPGAREEATAIAEMLGVSPLLRADATREAVTGGATRRQLIYLATHGVPTTRTPTSAATFWSATAH